MHIIREITTKTIPNSKTFTHTEMYRVNINSFPDYKHLLQANYMEHKYIYLPLLKLVSKIFQQDGTPPHWGSHVCRFLNATFPNRWIGKRWSNTLATMIGGYHPP